MNAHYVIQHTHADTHIRAAHFFGIKLDTAIHCAPSKTSTMHCMKKTFSVQQLVTALTYEDRRKENFLTYTNHAVHYSEPSVPSIFFKTTAIAECEEVQHSVASGVVVVELSIFVAQLVLSGEVWTIFLIAKLYCNMLEYKGLLLLIIICSLCCTGLHHHSHN